MPTSKRTPKNTIKVHPTVGSGGRQDARDRARERALPKVGDQITITATVTRIGRNTWDTADAITLRIPGYSVPVTVNPEHLETED
jgi:hypothetical protein